MRIHKSIGALVPILLGSPILDTYAQSASVFVPELAAMDNALCRTGATRGYPLLRLAQVAYEAPKKKSEISPAAPSAAKNVPATPSTDEPPLMPGLGARVPLA